MDRPSRIRCLVAVDEVTAPMGQCQKEESMKKSWKKPSMCQVAAGFEISRYLPAEVKK